MPSDPSRLDVVRAALAGRGGAYRAALAQAAQEAEALLLARTTAALPRNQRIAAELGPLGSARIDVGRLAEAFVETPGPNPTLLSAAESATAILRDLARTGDDVVVEVGAEETLRDAVHRGLAALGRGFGAAHVVGMVQTDRADHGEAAAWSQAYPFARWNRSERGLAPPLVVLVDGTKLHAGCLSEFLDGGMKLVLLVRGSAPPAPLVRLITPGVFVAQTHEGECLSRFAAWEGPGVVAWMPDSAAAFVHDPGVAPPAPRLEVSSFASAPRRSVGGMSPAQQEEELAHLRWLASSAGAPVGADQPVSAAAGAPDHPADRLAAWLLSQADLTAQ